MLGILSEPPVITPVIALTLVRGLPPESMFKTAASGIESAPWSQESYLLAAVYDAVNANTYVAAKAAGSKGYPKPEPFPRPGAKRNPKQNLFAAMARKAHYGQENN